MWSPISFERSQLIWINIVSKRGVESCFFFFTHNTLIRLSREMCSKFDSQAEIGNISANNLQ